MQGLHRRTVLQGTAAWAALACLPAGCATRDERTSRSTLNFTPVEPGALDRMHVASGHVAQVLVSWGDAVVAGAPPFDLGNQTPAAQVQQFGCENDYIAYLPLPYGSQSSTHGLLCVNHEGARIHMMRAGYNDAEDANRRAPREAVECAMAAQGHSVLEVECVDGRWTVVSGSLYGRRLDGLTTQLRVSGPAAGHARLRTSDDPSGVQVLGTFSNCAGGITPWGTVLTCEENINQMFTGSAKGTREERNHQRMGVGDEVEYSWAAHHARFDVRREPHEANRHGWVVEFDPYDPLSVPVKRTALGRFKHEGATCVVDPSGVLVVYMGDDDENEFLYKWVSSKLYNAADRTANRDLLDDGTLYVARFDPDGTLEWLPLVHGNGALDAVNGFESQADVLIEARSAATLLGATPLDRPEDVETNPVNGRVYVMLTNNSQRKEADAANPRPKNRHGHVLELEAPRDAQGRPLHSATRFAWEIFLLGGDVHAETTLSCPDNCAFDPRGRMWIATDGAARAGTCDGVWACDVDGAGRAQLVRFFSAPVGAEVCGPCFTPDGTTLFVAVQHPGEADAKGSDKGVAYATPTARFPDYDPARPPRSSVVALRRLDGGALGG